MKFRRLGAPIAVAAVAAMLVTGCTTTGDNKPATPKGGTITVAEVNELSSLNPSTPQGNQDINSKLWGYTRSGFTYLDNKLNIVPDKSFGTVEKTSDDPLTVKYTLAKTATWSDGTPVTADDLMLAWAIESGYFNDATFDPDTNAVTSGTNYFTYAGDTSGLGLAAKPVVGDNNMSLTVTYSEPYADWQLVTMIESPAHVVADQAGVALKDVLAAMQSMPRGDPSKPAPVNATLKKFADFWNTGFDVTSLPTDKSLYLSSAGMVLDSWVPKQSVTLVRNPDYKGALKPNVDKIVIRFIGDAQAQVTALQNGEVDVINPQSSADTVKSLEALKGVTTLTGNQFSYDHLDVSFNTPVFKDADVRKAFLMTIPRQQILDAIITPQNPNAKVLDSQLFFPGTDGYTKSIKVNGASAYDKVDIAGAKALLNGKTPEVRILYNTKNPNRVNSFLAIQASAEQAGFKIVDGGAENWGSLLGSGTYDASIFGWISSGVGVAGVPQIFSTKGGGNYNGYSNSQVDDLATKLQVTLDKKAQDDIEVQIDTMLYSDGYGVALFVGPGVFAYSNNVTGVVYNPGQTGVNWNYWEWAKK